MSVNGAVDFSFVQPLHTIDLSNKKPPIWRSIIARRPSSIPLSTIFSLYRGQPPVTGAGEIPQGTVSLAQMIIEAQAPGSIAKTHRAVLSAQEGGFEKKCRNLLAYLKQQGLKQQGFLPPSIHPEQVEMSSLKLFTQAALKEEYIRLKKSPSTVKSQELQELFESFKELFDPSCSENTLKMFIEVFLEEINTN